MRPGLPPCRVCGLWSPSKGIAPLNVSDYIRTSEAAGILGVSLGTVRNWADSGKLRSRRLPQNRYRLFLKKDLKAVLRALEGSERPSRASKSAPRRKRA